MNQKDFVNLCANGSVEKIEAAIGLDFDVNEAAFVAGARITPIFAALMEENIDAVKLLAKYGADVNEAFRAAIVKCKKKYLKLLIDCGANVNKADARGHTPLMFALLANKPKAVKWLLEFGADVNFKIDSSYNVITYAAFTHLQWLKTRSRRKINPEILSMLIKAGADYGEAMLLSVRHEDIGFLKLLLESGADINRRCSVTTPKTALEAAIFMAYSGVDTKVVKFLAENGADLNRVFELEDMTVTALNIIISLNRLDFAEVLLLNGADPNYVDSTGRGSIVYAIKVSTEMTEMLLRHGADPDLRDKYGRTPLMCAALDVESDEELLNVMIKFGADVNAQDNDGMTALMLIVAMRDRAPGILVSALIRTGAFKVEDGEEWFWIASLYIALKRAAQLDAIKLLVSHGADPTIPDNRGRTPLVGAIMTNDVEIVDIFSKREGL